MGVQQTEFKDELKWQNECDEKSTENYMERIKNTMVKVTSEEVAG